MMVHVELGTRPKIQSNPDVLDSWVGRTIRPQSYFVGKVDFPILGGNQGMDLHHWHFDVEGRMWMHQLLLSMSLT